MTTNNFEPEISNSNLNSAQYYIDDDGGFKFISPYLSSSNFDGTIPVIEDTINAEDIKPGMLILLDDQNYYAVVSVAYDDIDLEDTPSTNITVGYIDDNNELTAVVYDFTDQVDVRYEDWDNKDLGSQGWTITSGGNAIFANVGVRGDLEATTLDVGGDAGITYDGTSIIIGASVIINAPVTFNGSGSFVTFNNLSASYALISFVDTVNNRLSASLSSVSSSVSRLVINDNILSASITNLYNAGFVTDSDLVTNGATTITGNNITTGVINANLVNVSSGLTGNRGIKINSLGLFAYDSGSNPTLSIDSNTGNLTARGTIQATSGYFGSPTYGITIGDNGSAVALETQTLRIGSFRTSGITFGSINFYTTSGSALGNISATNSNKNWSLFGDGVGFGTSNDYFLLPANSNTNKARYFGSGFEWLNTSNQVIMSIAGGTGGLRVQNNTGGIVVSGGGNIEVTGTGRFVGDGSGLTNLPGGGSGGVTELKFGANQLWRSGRVYIDSASVVSALESNSIPNGKLINSSITIMSTTRSLGGSFIAGDIDGDVITANTLPPGKISNAANLFSLGGTGVARGNAITNISGPLTIGNLTVSTSLDYVTNLGTSPVNLNRAANPMTLNGVRTASATVANTLRNLPQIEGLSGQGIIVHGLGGLLGGLNYTASEADRYLQVNSTGTGLLWSTFSGMTNPMTAFGDLIYGGTNATPSVPTRLAIGTTGGILRVATSLGVNFPSWLARGTAGQVLRVNSGGTDIGWETINFISNPMTSVGDLIYGGASGVPTRLARGTAGQVLTVNSTATDIGWASPPAGTLPSQTGNNGRYLRTDGTNTSWAFPVTSVSVPSSAFTSTFDSSTGTNTISYTTTGGGDRNVLRSTAAGAVAMGKINGGHMNYTGPNTIYNPFMRMNSSTGDINLTNLNNSASSIRYKKIVNEPINLDSSWLDQINLIKFKYNLDIQSMGEEKAPVIIGLLAEELSENEVLNQLVSYDTENLPAAVDYEKISLLLIPIIKELRDQVANLEARLDAAGL